MIVQRLYSIENQFDIFCFISGPAKPVYKQYMNNALTPIPRSTAHRRKLTYKSLNTDDFECKLLSRMIKMQGAAEKGHRGHILEAGHNCICSILLC